MKIYLIRHGQTTGDIDDRYGGNYDDHLTDLGRSQAEELAKKLVGRDIEVVFASPLVRAQETAEILSDKLGAEVETVEGLRERNWYGILTGMVKAEAKEKYPDEVAKLSDYHLTASEGEEYVDFVERFSLAWRQILESGHETLAIVTHGSGPIKYVFRELLGESDIKAGDCGFAILEVADDKTLLIETDGIEVN
jgi:broad specificity phosphatase PhoE